jgi:anti-sigma regulatory factor (Ser/Thr protein kinase)
VHEAIDPAALRGRDVLLTATASAGGERTVTSPGTRRDGDAVRSAWQEVAGLSTPRRESAQHRLGRTGDAIPCAGGEAGQTSNGARSASLVRPEAVGVEQVRADLPGEPGSVRRARSFVRDALRTWRLDQLGDTAVLLVSELATNAVLHARTGFAVEVVLRGPVVRVTVHDCSPAAPKPRRHGPSSSTGRGLDILDQLADSWGSGSGRAPYEKAVWFEVRAS